MLSGALAAIAGFALVIHMPLGVLPRLAFVVAMLVGGGTELWALSRGAARVTAQADPDSSQLGGPGDVSGRAPGNEGYNTHRSEEDPGDWIEEGLV